MEVVKYDMDVAVIKELDAKYADIVIKDATSYAFVMSGLKEYRDRRLELDSWYKDKKKGALEYTNALGAERKKFKLLLEPGEQHLKDVRQVEDDRKAAIKAEKEAKEQSRIDDIQLKIEAIREKVNTTFNLPSYKVAHVCDNLVAMQITEEIYQEFVKQAKDTRLATLSALDDIYNDKVTQEKEAAERKAEIAKIEKLRIEMDKAKAEVAAENEKAEVKRHDELREIEAEKQAAQKIIDDERDKLEAEKRAEQEKRDRAEFERRAKEDAKDKAERDAKDKADKEEKERLEKEKESKRAEAVKPDKEKLIAFADKMDTLKLPNVKSNKAKDIVIDIGGRLIELQSDIREKAEAL